MANMMDAMKQLGEVAKLQKMLAGKIVEVTSANAEVTLKMNGKMEILKLEIAPALLTPAKKDYLERLLMRTWDDAQKQIQKVLMTELKPQMGNIQF